MRQLVESQTFMDWEDIEKQGANISGLGGVTVYVWYPFIVNSKAIRKGDEVVLHTLNEEPQKNAFDQLKSKYSRMPARK